MEIKGKIYRVGNGYAISIPKALITTKIFNIGDVITAKIEKVKKRDSNQEIQMPV